VSGPEEPDPDADCDPNPRCPECNGELQFVDGDELGQWLACEDCDYERRL
jgi:ssDNA-binding Zn-finger/Zn-ribbon topoisomerase 1